MSDAITPRGYSKLRPEHAPKGDPCSECGHPAAKHRVKHIPRGNPCDCGAPLENHRKRSPGERKRASRTQPKFRFAGIDGEGQGRSPHIYYLLAAATAEGERWYVENPEGISTRQALEFMLGLPRHIKLFAYSFNYDETKFLKDLPAKTLYKLFRPDERRGKHGPRAVYWEEFKLNLVASKFTIENIVTKRKRVIWDVWKFFRGKFVSALRDWKIQAALDEIEAMKEKRADFDRESKEAVRAYCFSECEALAALVQKLTDACAAADVPLKSYYGAGSIASAILDKMGIKDIRGEIPDAMKHAVSCAFFGGRFEHTVVGPIEGPLYSYDISSAYPYQLCFLPCLIHGKWSLTRNYRKMRGARAACVHYKLRTPGPDIWGPFPFRTPDGSIIFPAVSGGGWVWQEEYLEAEKHFKNVDFIEAWILEQDCDCNPPFAATSQFYLERLRLGKEAAGTVLKLGMNSEYGKLAQSSGSAPYQNWIWAGMTTSGTRAQFLELLGLHKDWSNMKIVATDGVYTKEKIKCPEPRDTGTSSAKAYGKWPLGAWDPPYGKTVENGMFAARPGVYFPLNPSDEDLAAFRARGLSRSVLIREWRRIIAAWDKGEKEVVIPSVTRFVGAKSGTLKTRTDYRRTESCGEWVEREIRLSFDPAPKRGPGMEILSVTGESLPYKKSVVSPEAELLHQTTQEEEEQPDGGDLTEEWS